MINATTETCADDMGTQRKGLLVCKLAPLYMEGKEQLRKEAYHSKLGGGGLVSKGTYTWGLSWATTRQADLAPAHQNLKSVLGGLTWAQ